jgi:hypothetical protein
MRVYISCPMTGNVHYKRMMEICADMISSQGNSFINPAKLDDVMPGASYEEYMNMDIEMLDKCDAIYLIGKWQQSLGCQREYGYALGRDIMVIDGNDYIEEYCQRVGKLRLWKSYTEE